MIYTERFAGLGVNRLTGNYSVNLLTRKPVNPLT